MKNLLIIILLLFPLSVFADNPIPVYVSVLPQKFFVEKIGGEKVDVNVLVSPGKNPATYSPSPRQVQKLVSARVYFRTGVPFENGFLHKIKSVAANIKIVDLSNGIRLRAMASHEHEHDEHHGHGNEPPDETSGKDPHIWMSPLLAKKQALTICDTLSDIDPTNQIIYRANYSKFIEDLDRLHHEIKGKLAGLQNSDFFVFHPSFGYFADTYGLKQIAFEKMGKAPKGKEFAEIIKKINLKKSKVVFVQPQFDKRTAGKIAAAIQGRVVAIDPLAENYFENMVLMADTIAGALTSGN